MNKKYDIKFLNPDIQKKEIEMVNASIMSGWMASGEYTKKFETDISRFLSAEGAVFLNSCTSAIHLALIMAGIREGDEVITTPLSYVATSNPIIYEKAKPVFVDVDISTGLIDLDKIEKAITNKTKAIIPVHLFGQMVDMKKLSQIAKKHKLFIIEDAAHSLESSRDNIRPGQLSFAACFSFHVAKNITCGQGGALVSMNHKIIEKAKILRRDGVINVGNQRTMVDFGHKYDSTDFQAAMLIGQLKRISKINTKRSKVMENYRQGLKNLQGITFPKKIDNSVHSGHMFVIWVDPKIRDELRDYLANRGIQTSVHYNPIHLEPYYRNKFGFKKGDFPVAERLGFGTITLPTNTKITEDEQRYIIKSIKDFFNYEKDIK